MSGYIPAGGVGGVTDPAGTGVVGAVVEFIPVGVVVDPVVPAGVVTLAPGAVAFTEDVVGVLPVGAGVDPAGAGVDPAGAVVEPAGAGVDPVGAGVALLPPAAVGMGIGLRASALLAST